MGNLATSQSFDHHLPGITDMMIKKEKDEGGDFNETPPGHVQLHGLFSNAASAVRRGAEEACRVIGTHSCTCAKVILERFRLKEKA